MDRVMLVAVNVVVSALFLVAGVSKLYAPGQLGRAIADVLRRRIVKTGVMSALVRSLAAVELVACLGLMVPDTRSTAAGLTGVLGCAFACFGLIGWRAGSTVACGCIADSSRSPLGLPNVSIGISLVLAAGANYLLSAASVSQSDYFGLTAAGTALAAMVLALLLHRRLLLNLTRAVRPLEEDLA